MNSEQNSNTEKKILKDYLHHINFTDESIAYLDHGCSMHHWTTLHGCRDCVDIIRNLEPYTPVVIVGDFDCDGITSTSILYLVLKKIGFRNVHFIIPHRIHEGYGLSIKVIDRMLKRYPDTKWIITCDNGINALEAIRYARKKDIRIIVTDHHLPNNEWEQVEKETDCIVHPYFSPTPFADISGAQVAYKVAWGLLESCHVINLQFQSYLHQLSALSIISDVMPVASSDIEKAKVNENREWLKKGIHELIQRPDWHMQLFFERLGFEKEKIDETTIGFYLAPILNATGRLANAEEAVKFLIEKNREEASRKLSCLFYLNERRKELKMEGVKRIEPMIDESQKAFILQLDDFPEGVIGILAGNICEKYQKPCIVLTNTEINGEKMWKGSARSPSSIHLFDALSLCKDHLYAFGGHAQAAGLTVKDSELDTFQKAFLDSIPDASGISSSLSLDTVPLSSMQMEAMAKEVMKYKPYGNGLPCPIFEIELYINQIDFFFSSNHCRFSNPFGIEFWIYEKADEIYGSKDRDNFNLVRTNVESRKETMDESEAYEGRWECWRSSSDVKVKFKARGELTYGLSSQGRPGPIFAVKSYDRVK